MLPQDSRITEDKTGRDLGPFWCGAKRYPTATLFNSDDAAHTSFLLAATALFAVHIGALPHKKENDTEWLLAYRPADRSWIIEIAKTLVVPAYTVMPIYPPVDEELQKTHRRDICSSLLAILQGTSFSSHLLVLRGHPHFL